MQKVLPQLKLGGFPVWCHNHSLKMRLVVSTENRVVIRGSAATLAVTFHEVDKYGRRWRINWLVMQSVSENVRGEVEFYEDHLAAAFGLTDKPPSFPELSQWLIDRYGADVATQGRFIRYQDYLNIPCPGTGHDGDPNISVLLDEEMKEAVRLLIDSVHR
jgi:hypothetical protein